MEADLIKAWAELAWPVLAAIALFALLPTLIQLARSRALSIKYGGMEISVQDASDQLRKQVEDLQNQVQALSARHSEAAARGEEPERAVVGRQLRRGLILWVDDNPKNNAHEIAKLQDDGWEVITADSTVAALAVLDRISDEPALIISDMGRREGILFRKTAGLELIRQVRSRNLEIPIVIYSSPDAARAYEHEVRGARGSAITASPLELFRLVETAATPLARSPS